jgi:hypothetical protein
MRRILVVPTALAVSFVASIVACEDQPEGRLPGGPPVDAPVSHDAMLANDDSMPGDGQPIDAPTDAPIDAPPDTPVG